MSAIAHWNGHSGIEKTLERSEAAGWWPSIKDDVEHFIYNCLPCIASNLDAQVVKGSLGHQTIKGPWHRLQIDDTELPHSRKGFKYCLVTVDTFTK